MGVLLAKRSAVFTAIVFTALSFGDWVKVAEPQLHNLYIAALIATVAAYFLHILENN